MVKNDFTKVYSYSKIARFEKCPLDYYFYYLDPKWKGHKKPRDYKTKGQAIHGALTLFYHLEPQKRTLKNLKECLSQSWFSEIDPEKRPPLGKIGGFKSLAHERSVYWQSLKMLEKFFELGDINPPLFYMPSKNVRYSFNDYEEMIQPLSNEFLISGKFDRIDKLEDGSLKVIDFKTGNKNQNRFQLDFYKVLAELNFKIPVSTVSFYYLKSGEIVDVSSKSTTSQKIKKKILKKTSDIKNEKDFRPSPSKLCNYCDFQEVCPVFNT